MALHSISKELLVLHRLRGLWWIIGFRPVFMTILWRLVSITRRWGAERWTSEPAGDGRGLLNLITVRVVVVRGM